MCAIEHTGSIQDGQGVSYAFIIIFYQSYLRMECALVCTGMSAAMGDLSMLPSTCKLQLVL